MLQRLSFAAPTSSLEEMIRTAEKWTIADAKQVPDNPVKVEAAAYDLNGDGQEEIIARLQAQVICANLGCPLILYRQVKGELEVIQKLYTNEEVAISSQRHNGYHDLILNAQHPMPVQCHSTWNGSVYDSSKCK